MIDKVRSKRSGFNNSEAISRSGWLSKGKVYYYEVMLIASGLSDDEQFSFAVGHTDV